MRLLTVVLAGALALASAGCDRLSGLDRLSEVDCLEACDGRPGDDAASTLDSGSTGADGSTSDASGAADGGADADATSEAGAPDAAGDASGDAGSDAAPPVYFAQACPPGAVYTDPFELDPIASGNWTLTAGAYTFDPLTHTVTLTPATKSPAQMWIGPRPGWNRYTVSVAITFPNDTSGNGGLNFHVEDLPNPAPNNAGHAYFDGIGPGGTNGYIDLGAEADGWNDLKSITATFNTSVTYELAVTVADSSISVTVNGNAYLTNFADPSGSDYTSGSIAIRAWGQVAAFGPVTVACE